ncbi:MULTISPECIES: prepilin-type N-terminal cleavage/methylation domain-containing protein [Aeromonas]|jgi:MSHA pilin protein MshA|uniref:MSHA biogenesis protein MshA n=1 Tax=Aeromonas veronii TaxID=654 RepID=A0A2T4N837_AERVE|nr:prepilin-type N-terminal cleavage/methylation domain-containing protein [Aeromonas veronii]AXV20925.1 MSHA biogenesis protein MshA [Aeromonas veronii]MBL0490348.1 prepilin-type N-terminal cleavage/methylation domain-containing protein [Aeromonas veronii]MBL0505924.1 prepilin-type N-terminal cleavage/methylation domain-containing protein [Aeromonas veronii]PTH82993.1 MSHA biogenesis protein MshA [Aeromonas veronii]RDE61320.1 prepilin-type N-terminal cleavage/methylation domain-containing pro
MKKQAGFTLIELVIVIIILGILAVTAAPKFLNLQDDAKKAAADGVLSGISSAMQLVYSKSALEGEEKAEKTDNPAPSVESAGGVVATHFGYPTAASAGIEKAISLDGAWKGEILDDKSTPPTYQFYSTDKDGNAVNSSPCVIYTEASSATAAAMVKKGEVTGGKCA